MNDNERTNMNLAALLRACADGELNDDDRSRLDAMIEQDPELASCVEFEHALKGACASAMERSSGCCPESLRASISSMCGAASGEAPAPSAVIEMSAHTRERSFWQRGGLIGAMAAALLVASGVLLYTSSSFITGNSGFSAPETTPVSYSERVGDFVSREHSRCTDEHAAKAKLFMHDLSAVNERYSESFGKPVSIPVPEDGSGLVFYGGGDCHLPATDLSAHLRFDMVGTDGVSRRVSVFVAPDPGLLEIDEGMAYTAKSASCASVGASLYFWVRDGLLYVMVAEVDETQCGKVRKMLNAPDEVGSL